MPLDYLFEFTAHIDERKRPEGFPRKVFVREQYDQVPAEALRELYNNRAKALVTSVGLSVFLNDPVLTDPLGINQRVFIPWHMITHFQGELKPIMPKPEPILLEQLTPPNGPAPKEAKKEDIN
jgi:hypothetical protein